MDNEWLAKKLVNYTEHIGQKDNPSIPKARKRWGAKTRGILKKDSIPFNEAKRLKATRMLDAWCDVDYGPLAIKGKSGYRLKKKVGHTVRINYNPANKKLAEKVWEQCLRNGAKPHMAEMDTAKARKTRILSPEDSLREFSPISRAIDENLDYVVSLDTLEREDWRKGIPTSKFLASAPAGMKSREIMDARQIRWLLVGWPHPGIAKDLNFPAAKFKRIVENSIKWSYKKQTYDLIWAYHKKLDGKKSIRIVHDDGTDLSFSTRGRRFLCDDGVLSDDDIKHRDVGMNIPCGEIFTAPKEHSANGILKIPRNPLRGHGVAEGIELVFKNGKVVEYSAEKNQRGMDRMFEEHTGDKFRIAELGIGCNKGAEFTNGYTIVDEKILGTLHIAIGWNLGYGGKNNSTLHLDFVKPMFNGRLIADGRTVMRNGVIVK